MDKKRLLYWLLTHERYFFHVVQIQSNMKGHLHHLERELNTCATRTNSSLAIIKHYTSTHAMEHSHSSPGFYHTLCVCPKDCDWSDLLPDRNRTHFSLGHTGMWLYLGKPGISLFLQKSQSRYILAVLPKNYLALTLTPVACSVSKIELLLCADAWTIELEKIWFKCVAKHMHGVSVYYDCTLIDFGHGLSI